MDTQNETWKLIANAAAAMGVKEGARKKWRVRGIPHKWRLAIIQSTGGAVTVRDFAAFDRKEKDQ